MSALALALGGGAVAFACASGEPEVLTPAAGVAPRVSAAEAVDSISRARCDRAFQCDEIGVENETDFQSREQCTKSMAQDASQALSVCVDGIAQRALLRCLTEIGNQDCSGVSRLLDDVEEFFVCRAGALCLD